MTTAINALPSSQAQLLHELLSLMDTQITTLDALHTTYERAPDLQVTHGYLKGWFPSRIEALAEQRTRIAPALDDVAYRRSEVFSSALRWYQSLGQGFDVDLAWSGREDEVFTRNGEMYQVARTLDDKLAPERA